MRHRFNFDLVWGGPIRKYRFSTQPKVFKMKFAKLSSTVGAFRNQRGAAMIEYALIAALIAVFAITALSLVGTNLSAIFNNIAGQLD